MFVLDDDLRTVLMRCGWSGRPGNVDEIIREEVARGFHFSTAALDILRAVGGASCGPTRGDFFAVHFDLRSTRWIDAEDVEALRRYVEEQDLSPVASADDATIFLAASGRVFAFNPEGALGMVAEDPANAVRVLIAGGPFRKEYRNFSLDDLQYPNE